MIPNNMSAHAYAQMHTNRHKRTLTIEKTYYTWYIPSCDIPAHVTFFQYTQKKCQGAGKFSVRILHSQVRCKHAFAFCVAEKNAHTQLAHSIMLERRVLHTCDKAVAQQQPHNSREIANVGGKTPCAQKSHRDRRKKPRRRECILAGRLAGLPGC